MSLIKLSVRLIVCCCWLFGCSGSNSSGSSSLGASSSSTSTSVSSSSTSSSSSSSSDISSTDGFELLNFEILGANLSGGGQTTVNPVVDEGEFGVNWTVKSPQENYYVSIYVSQDEDLGVEDILVFSELCDLEISSCGTEDFQGANCVFFNSNELACGLDQEVLVDISPVLDELPKELNLILETCNNSNSDCSVLFGNLTFL